MKKLNSKILKTIKCIAGIELENSIYSWPPPCSGIFHQPKRPKKSDKVE
ncbi:AgrD family cyclic lactone autoinducer peptide [Konateibacter massiliensis]|nr:cyclic lactone autoinducer peptide [Konateibacter massiliensis]